MKVVKNKTLAIVILLTLFLVIAMIHDCMTGDGIDEEAIEKLFEKSQGFIMEKKMPFLEQAIPFYKAIFSFLAFFKSITVVLILYGIITWFILPLAVCFFCLFFLTFSINLLIELLKAKERPNSFLCLTRLSCISINMVLGIAIGYFGTIYTIMPLIEIVMSQSGR